MRLTVYIETLGEIRVHKSLIYIGNLARHSSGFLLDPGRRDLYSAISILVPAILSGGAYRYL